MRVIFRYILKNIIHNISMKPGFFHFTVKAKLINTKIHINLLNRAFISIFEYQNLKKTKKNQFRVFF